MNTIIWIFHNIMPWIGAWFTTMTVIFLIVTIIYIFTKSDFSYWGIVEPAKEEFSLIVSYVPMAIVALLALITVGISRIPLLAHKIRNKISNIRFIAK